MPGRELPMHLIRAVVVILIALVFAATVNPVTAQQAPDPAGVAGMSATPANPAGAVGAQQSEPATMPAGPRLAPQFQEFEPSLPRGSAPENASLAARGGQHTIVISTLVLVLAVIIIVLLVAN